MDPIRPYTRNVYNPHSSVLAKNVWFTDRIVTFTRMRVLCFECGNPRYVYYYFGYTPCIGGRPDRVADIPTLDIVGGGVRPF